MFHNDISHCCADINFILSGRDLIAILGELNWTCPLDIVQSFESYLLSLTIWDREHF